MSPQLWDVFVVAKADIECLQEICSRHRKCLDFELRVSTVAHSCEVYSVQAVEVNVHQIFILVNVI